jgi:uncharacterized protein YbjT (DUF2867 family)
MTKPTASAFKAESVPTRTALLAGSTGLVGRELLALLLVDSRYSAVHCVGRRAPFATHPKLITHLVHDLTDATQLRSVPAVDDVYIALGTTIKVAGSQAAFTAVDYGAVVALAQSNLAQAATKSVAHKMHIGVVSAMGADVASRVFYNRTKGNMEAAISQLGYGSVSIARPSMIAGDRASLAQAGRAAEGLGLKLMGAMNFLIPANYQTIDAADVAAALLRMVTQGTRGVRVVLSGELHTLAKT